MKIKNILLALALVITSNSFAYTQIKVKPTNTDQLAVLMSKKGDAFDRAFLARMINHNKNGIKLANIAVKNAKHKALINFARQVRANKLIEIKKLQQLQQKWGYKKINTLKPRLTVKKIVQYQA